MSEGNKEVITGGRPKDLFFREDRHIIPAKQTTMSSIRL